VAIVMTGAGLRGDQSVISITIHEGRTRQVRKMCEAIGHPVVRLRRERIGPLTDPSLKTGLCRTLTGKEVDALRRAARPGRQDSGFGIQDSAGERRKPKAASRKPEAASRERRQPEPSSRRERTSHR
jgi:hypothetical protein